jgi:hypothetical protein
MADLPEITEVERLVLQPWETLIVHVGCRIDPETAHRIKEHVLAALPRGARVLVCDETISFEVVTPSETAQSGRGGE